MKLDIKEVEFFAAITGQDILEVKKMLLARNRAYKLFRDQFGLNKQEVDMLLCHKEKIVELARGLKEKNDAEVQERVRKIEAAAVKKMRDPRRERQLRSLLTAR